MPALPFKQVDVFTERPFLGNPVAVVIGADRLDAAAMQRIASWTNLSETTFLLPPTAAGADYRLRIFTPRMELPFAGHPTLGSAHAAIESGYVRPGAAKLRQECGAGVLDLSVEGSCIFVRVPEARASQAQIPELAAALQGTLTAAPLRIDVGVVWIVAQVDEVSTLHPDLAAVARLSEAHAAAGVTVFSRSSDGVSAIHVRSFAPAHGIAEDPVCGSGNASVGAYLREYDLLPEFGAHYVARQGLQVGRDGRVQVRVTADSIEIGGYAVTTVDVRVQVER